VIEKGVIYLLPSDFTSTSPYNDSEWKAVVSFRDTVRFAFDDGSIWAVEMFFRRPSVGAVPFCSKSD